MPNSRRDLRLTGRRGAGGGAGERRRLLPRLVGPFGSPVDMYGLTRFQSNSVRGFLPFLGNWPKFNATCRRRRQQSEDEEPCSLVLGCDSGHAERLGVEMTFLSQL
jgi:hypothetical protein